MRAILVFTGMLSSTVLWFLSYFSRIFIFFTNISKFSHPYPDKRYFCWVWSSTVVMESSSKENPRFSKNEIPWASAGPFNSHVTCNCNPNYTKDAHGCCFRKQRRGNNSNLAGSAPFQILVWLYFLWMGSRSNCFHPSTQNYPLAPLDTSPTL